MESGKLTHIQSGKRIRLKSVDDKNYHRQLKLFTLPSVLLIVLIVVIILPIWESGFPWGSDSWGHLHRATYTQEIMQQKGIIAGFIDSAWMTDWYMGDPTRVYYPPMTVWLLSTLSLITGDVLIAYRVLVTTIIFILGCSVYVVGVRWSQNVWAAAIGACLAIMAPYTLRTIFAEGNLPRGLAILTLPWLIYYVETTLTNKNTSWLFVWMSLLWCFAIVAHVMQAVIFAVIIVFFIIFRILNNVYIPVRRGLLAILPIMLGGGLAGFYLLPAYGHFELKDVPSLPASKIDIFSINLSALLTNPVSMEMISIGIITICFALFISIIIAKEHQKALSITGIIAIIFAFGTKGILFLLVPMNQSLLPERFLNASAIIFPLIIATTPKHRIKYGWLLIGLAFVAFIEFPSAWRVIHMRDAPPTELAIAETLAHQKYDGRIAPLTFPNPTASQIFLTSDIGKHENVSGWALENTPHQASIRRLLTAVQRSPEYLERILSLWNADYFTTNTENEFLLSNLPYKPIAENDYLQLWETTQPTDFVQILPDDRMLMLGDNATSWLFAFPYASESYTARPDELSQPYLDKFSAIGLTRIDNVNTVEPMLENWVAKGNTLIVDLSGMKGLFNQGFSLFGVQAFPITLEEETAIKWTDDLSDMPDEFSFGDAAWVGASYRGLEETLATISLNGTEFPLLGYQSIGKGRVWYVGLNLLYWLDISEQRKATETLANYLLSNTNTERQLTLPALNIRNLNKQSTHIEFNYTSETKVDAVISMTYFPRWKASVDGETIELHNHEHLIMLQLPEGTHEVVLKYETYSTISYAGFAVSVITALGTVFIATTLTYFPPLAAPDRVHNFVDRLELQAPSPVFNKEFVTCPNCGQKKAITGPPTKESYPFVSIECQNCNYKL